jgi:hypothetical protein
MATSDSTITAGGRPVRVAFTPAAVIIFVIGIALTAWPSGRVGVAMAGLTFLWVGAMIAARQSGPMIRFGGTFFLASALWAGLGFGFPASFDRWPADPGGTSSAGPLPAATLTDDRYKGLVALNATVRATGTEFIVTNDGAQPWQDVTLSIVDASSEEYAFRLPALEAGQTTNASALRFTTSRGSRFNPRRSMPRTFIVTAEIGAGGPAGVYAVRL